MKKSAIFSAIIISMLTLSMVAAFESPAPVPGTNLPADPFKGIADLFTSLLKGVGEVFGTAVGANPFGLAQDVFARMVIFLLVAVIIFKPAEKLTGNKPASWIVAIGVSLLGVRFIDVNIINAVLLPYGALALALSTMLPMILYGIFIYSEDVPAWIRGAGWWIFFACWLALYIWRTPTVGTDSLMYLISGGISLGLALFDNRLNGMIERLKMGSADLTEKVSMMTAEKAKLESDYQAVIEQKDREIAAGTANAARIQDWNARIANLSAALQAANELTAKLGKRIKTPKKTSSKR